MPLAIFCPYPDEPVPRTVRLELRCDGVDHGLFPCPAFVSDERYPAARSAAGRQGWKISAVGQVFGPCCSGKVRESDDES